MAASAREKHLPGIEVCFSPKLYPFILAEKNFIVVMVDILRASTSICAAIDYGVKSIIPVAGTEKAKEYKAKGYLVASERDGNVLDFADFGNSAFNFMVDEVKGKTIAYSTTNGTKAIEMAKESEELLIGSFVNLKALSNYLLKKQQNVVILCAGWKGKFNLEDSVYAGALTRELMTSGMFETECDSAKASMDLWNIAEKDLLTYIDKASHRHRLRKMVLDDVLEYTFTLNSSEVVPGLRNGEIINLT